MRKIVLAVLLLSFAATAFAQATPDLWRIHYNSNGVKATMDGIEVRDGILNLGLTLRDNGHPFQDESKNNIYAYLRSRLSGVSLGSGELIIQFHLRGATDTSGTAGGPKYNFYYDSLDSARGNNAWDFRLYNAFVTFDQVVPYIKLTAGRLYIDHLTELQIDGADLKIGNDLINAFIYYGLPVSYYISDMKTQVFGGGAETHPMQNLHFRAEVMQFSDDTDADEYGKSTLYWKARADYTYSFPFADGVLYGSAGMLENAWFYDVGTYGTIARLGTIYNLWVRGQYDSNRYKQLNLAISEFDLTNGAESEHWMIGGHLNHSFTEKFAAGLGFETRFNFNNYYGDRDYIRGMLNLDFIGLFAGNYLSITGDYWHIPSDKRYQENNKLYIGGRLSQILTDKIEMWAGASLTNYRYYYKQYKILPANAPNGGRNDSFNNSVYIFYAGVNFMPRENLLLQLDYTFENSQVIKAFDTNNDQISTINAMISYNF